MSSFQSNYKILVVDSDARARKVLVDVLRRENYLVAESSNEDRALIMIDKNKPDLVVLDVLLSHSDGFKFLQKIITEDKIPVIVASTLLRKEQLLKVLTEGADDYISKPFSPKELMLRVKSVLRRTGTVEGVEEAPKVKSGDIELDPNTREIIFKGQALTSTAKEYALLLHFMKNPGVTFSRLQLLNSVWGSSEIWQSEATVTEHIRRLRSKIEEDSSRPKRIETVRGTGYRFRVSKRN